MRYTKINSNILSIFFWLLSFQGGMGYGGDETLGTSRPSYKYALIISKPSKVQAFEETQIHIFA